MAVHVLVMLEYRRTKDGFAGSVLTMEAALFSGAKKLVAIELQRRALSSSIFSWAHFAT
jgi:hypothetical protein